MKNKQMLLANIPFILVIFMILIVGLLDFVDFKILIPLMLICTGCQQLFIGLRFYKENKKIKIQHMLCSSGYFAVTIFIILKIYRLV